MPLLPALPTAASAQTAEGLKLSSSAFASPSTAAYQGLSGMVADTRIHRLNVFDPDVPGENWWPFRLANLLHIQTREHIIRRELRFGPGDPWDGLKALESERALRASDYVRKAEIRPMDRGEPGRLDLEARVQDAWTTAPQVNVGTEGGDRFLIYGIEEANLLGYGKGASFFHAQVGPEHRNEFRYRDPRFHGSRVRLTSLYADTAKGDEIGVLLDRPFFSLESTHGWSALWARIIQEDTLFRNGDDYSRFDQNFRAVSANLGGKASRSEDSTHRFYAGTYYERDEFTPTSETVPGTLPADREMSGPTLSYTLTQPRFIKETYINKMDRVEDFNLGNEFSTTMASMMRTFGSDSDRWTFNALDQQGLSLGRGRFALGQLGAQGRLRHGRLENALFYANLNLFWKTWLLLPQTWVLHLEGNTTQSLDRENQLLLGGSSGLRGYKSNSFTGTRSVLLNLESRLFVPKEFLHLAYFGGAVFFEAGAVASEGDRLARGPAKSDLGLGLRMSPSRSAAGAVMRVDLAYALNRGPGSDRWVVSVRGGQAFDIPNSTNRTLLRNPAAVVSEESAGVRLRRR